MRAHRRLGKHDKFPSTLSNGRRRESFHCLNILECDASDACNGAIGILQERLSSEINRENCLITETLIGNIIKNDVYAVRKMRLFAYGHSFPFN